MVEKAGGAEVPPVRIPKRQSNRLSPGAINNLNQPGRYPDGAGLWLQVSATGARSWVFIYRLGKRGESKQTWLGLGPLHTVSLKEARIKARELRQSLLEGRDPLAEKRAASDAISLEVAGRITFGGAAERFIASHRTAWKNAKHVQQWQNTLATYAEPYIGHLPVAAINVGHVLRVLEQPANPSEPEGPTLWATKPETAKRVRGRIESILTWAEGRGYRSGKNPATWRGGLDAQLPAPGKVRKVVHHPAVSVDDMPAFMAELRKREGVSARSLEFQCLTAARTGEVIGATWAEVDLEAAVWQVPAERMKGGRPHSVPLSPRALEILRHMPHRDGPLFVGRKGGPLSNAAAAELMKGMRSGVTVHGTARSTFRDWAAERTNYAREVVEMSLAHAIGDKVEAAYRRGDLLTKRKALMNAWASFCSSQYLNGGSVKLLILQVPQQSAAG